jgi:hypothetical protein
MRAQKKAPATGAKRCPTLASVPDDQERQESRFAIGTPNHPGGSFDIFTGR